MCKVKNGTDLGCRLADRFSHISPALDGEFRLEIPHFFEYGSNYDTLATENTHRNQPDYSS